VKAAPAKPTKKKADSSSDDSDDSSEKKVVNDSSDDSDDSEEKPAKRSRTNSKKAKELEVPTEKRSRSNSKSKKAEESKGAPVTDGPTEIMIKSLSFDTTDESLSAHFEQYGELTKCKLLKGMAFVEYTCPAHAAAAVAGSNGATLDSRQIWVEFSKGPAQ